MNAFYHGLETNLRKGRIRAFTQTLHGKNRQSGRIGVLLIYDFYTLRAAVSKGFGGVLGHPQDLGHDALENLGMDGIADHEHFVYEGDRIFHQTRLTVT